MTALSSTAEGSLNVASSHPLIFVNWGPNATRASLLVVFLIAAGAQWGMIAVAFVFSSAGRTMMAASPELLVGLVGILIAATVAFNAQVAVISSRSVLIVLAPLFCFVAFSILSGLAQEEQNWRFMITLCSFLLYFLAGGTCAFVLGEANLRSMVLIVLIVAFAWYIGLLLLWASGYLSYDRILAGSVLRRLEVPGGFTATEIPMSIGQQLPFFLVGALSRTDRMVRLLSRILIICAAIVLVMSASIGALVAAILVLFIFALTAERSIRIKSLLVLFSIAVLLSSIGAVFLSGLLQALSQKMEILAVGGGRIETVMLLIDVIRDHPWIGIGKGEFQLLNDFGYFGGGLYPHNNLLGIAAELGLLAASSYVAFLVIIGVMLIRGASRLKKLGFATQANILVAVLGVIIYQQARGLLHDTWTLKEMYFWAGFGAGVIGLTRYLALIKKNI